MWHFWHRVGQRAFPASRHYGWGEQVPRKQPNFDACVDEVQNVFKWAMQRYFYRTMLLQPLEFSANTSYRRVSIQHQHRKRWRQGNVFWSASSSCCLFWLETRFFQETWRRFHWKLACFACCSKIGAVCFRCVWQLVRVFAKHRSWTRIFLCCEVTSCLRPPKWCCRVVSRKIAFDQCQTFPRVLFSFTNGGNATKWS